MLAEDKKADLVHVAEDSSMADYLDIHPFLRVAKTLPEAGDRVLVVGNPEGLERTVSEGIVSAVRNVGDYGNVIQISAPISPGSSGSPVLNLKGEVVGVATFVDKEGQNLNFAVSAERFDRMRQLVGESLAVRTECNLKDQDGVKTELAKLGEYRKALEFCEAATKRTPDNSTLWSRLGYCHNQLGHHGVAVEVYQKAISLDPQGERLHYHLGQAHFNLTKYRDAANAYREEIRHNPKDFEARTELCGSYNRLGLYQEEVKACQRALKLKSNFVKARYNLGIACPSGVLFEGRIVFARWAEEQLPASIMARCKFSVEPGVYKYAAPIEPSTVAWHVIIGKLRGLQAWSRPLYDWGTFSS